MPEIYYTSFEIPDCRIWQAFKSWFVTLGPFKNEDAVNSYAERITIPELSQSVWNYKKNKWFITLGDFPDKAQALKVHDDFIQKNQPDKIKTVSVKNKAKILYPKIQCTTKPDQKCLICDLPIKTHHKPALKLHLTTICNLLQKRGITLGI